jgi:hypothetical protein
MTCFAVLLLAWIILFVGVGLAIGLLTVAAALLIIAVVAALAFLLYFWRVIYPWLVRMGRWAAQLKNTIFLLVVLGSIFIVWYLLNQVGIQIPTTLLLIVGIPLGVLFVFLLLLAIVVWLVRLWRYTWPRFRNLFFDICFRIVALGWKILVGIPLGIVWFFYHPPLRWLVAVFLFYFRRISAAVAWLLYNPPLRNIIAVGLFITRLVAWVAAWLLYNPPISWVIEFGLFILRLTARFISTIIYIIWLWWPIQGVRRTLRRGITAESKSYRDYKYAPDDDTVAA